MSIQSLRVSAKAKRQLIRLKQQTGIRNWNVLCRWAFCASLAEPSKPAIADIPADSNVEMSWKVFGGQHSEVYAALLTSRCKQDGIPLDATEINRHFRLHVHRGIDQISALVRAKKFPGLLATTIVEGNS